jgi:hypothetical protein
LTILTFGLCYGIHIDGYVTNLNLRLGRQAVENQPNPGRCSEIALPVEPKGDHSRCFIQK